MVGTAGDLKVHSLTQQLRQPVSWQHHRGRQEAWGSERERGRAEREREMRERERDEGNLAAVP